MTVKTKLLVTVSLTPPLFVVDVAGEAQPAGSKTAQTYRRRDGSIVTTKDGRPLVRVRSANKREKGWRDEMGQVFGRWAATTEVDLPLDGPLYVLGVVYRQRPKSHLRANGSPLDSAPSRPHTRPDLLKLYRAIEDALQESGIIREDSRFCLMLPEKRFGRPRIELRVGMLAPEDGILGENLVTGPADDFQLRVDGAIE